MRLVPWSALLLVACGVSATPATPAPPPSVTETTATSHEDARVPSPSVTEAKPTEMDAGVSSPSTTPDAATPPVEQPLPAEAVALKEACAQRRAQACDDFANLLRKLGRLVEARAAFAAACDLGLVAGCGHHAYVIEEGIGGPADPSKGKALHVTACRNGHAPSCERLGQLADRDNDPKTGLAFWSRACELSGGSACRRVGEHHRDGKGTPVDFASARRAFTRACDTRDGVSCMLLCDVGSQIDFCKHRPH
jgi:TPR repeat protein